MDKFFEIGPVIVDETIYPVKVKASGELWGKIWFSKTWHRWTYVPRMGTEYVALSREHMLELVEFIDELIGKTSTQSYIRYDQQVVDMRQIFRLIASRIARIGLRRKLRKKSVDSQNETHQRE